MHIPKVLLVHDDPASLLALERLLAPEAGRRGYQLVKAGSGDAALGEVLRHDVAVILLNLDLPGMAGLATAAALRSHPRAAAVPVIFIAAAHADEAQQLRAYEHGAADFLCAPLVPPVVQAKVGVFVELTRRRLELQAQAEETRRINAELRSQRLRDLEQANRDLQAEVAERKLAEQRAHELSTRDALTGLVNRRSLIRHLEHAVASSQRRHGQFALLFLDLDDFKQVNDGFGHDIGDEMLRQVAARLAAAVRASDVVARLGGDEFVVLIEGRAPAENAARVARKIASAHARPFPIGENSLHTSTSIGIALYPHDGASARALMRSADLAMYRAKEQRRHQDQDQDQHANGGGGGGGGGGTICFFHEEMNCREHEREQWTAELRQALAAGELALLYQPQVTVAAGRVRGVEAQLVWHHPRLGTIDAAKFLPALHDRGLLERIDAWVMAGVCAQAAAWRSGDSPLARVRVAVNLAAPALGPDLPARLLAEVRRHALPPSAIVLEIPEALLAAARNAAIEPLLRQLQAGGVLLALDGFGHAGTSLAACKRLGLDILKIDDAFVRNIGDSAGGTDLVAAIVHLARALSMQVAATGVEHAHQLAVLATLGCDDWQGTLFCAPCGAAGLADLLEQHR